MPGESQETYPTLLEISLKYLAIFKYGLVRNALISQSFFRILYHTKGSSSPKSCQPLATRTSLRQSYPHRKQRLQTSPYIIHGSVLITRINLLTVARQTTSRLLNLHADIKDRQSSMERASGGVCVTVFDVELLVTLQLYHWPVMPGRDAGI